MDRKDTDRIHELCSLIAVEKDQQKFLTYVEELNRILAAKEYRLQKQELDDQERKTN